MPGSNAHGFQTVCSSDNQPRKTSKIMARFQAITSGASLKLRRLDPVKMAYLRTSFIFGLAIFVTWIPSSINRLYSITNDNKVSFYLSVASGCVLPLQGVWNALIYFATSWQTVREEIRALARKLCDDQVDNRRTALRPDGGLYTPQRRHTFEDSHEVDRVYGPAFSHRSDEVELCDRSHAADQL
jgi:hypothetical protein